MKQKKLFIAFIATVLMALVCPQSTIAKDYLGHPYEGKMKKKVPMGEGVITIGNYTIKGTFDGSTISNATLDLKFLGYYKGTITFDESNDIILQKDGCLTLLVYDKSKNRPFKTDIHIDEPTEFTQSEFQEGEKYRIPVKFSLSDSQEGLYDRYFTKEILQVFPNLDIQGEATYIKLGVYVVKSSSNIYDFEPFLLDPGILNDYQSHNYYFIADPEWGGNVSKKYQGLDLNIEFARDYYTNHLDLLSYCLKTPAGHSLFCDAKYYKQKITMPDSAIIKVEERKQTIELPNGIEMASSKNEADLIKTYKVEGDERKIDKQIELLKRIQEHGIEYNGKLNAICIPNSKKMASDSIVKVVKTLSSQYPLSDTIEIQDDKLNMPNDNFFYRAYEHLEGQYSGLDEFIEKNHIESWRNNKIVYPRDNCSGYYCSGVFRGIKEIEEDVKNRRNVVEARCKELEAIQKAQQDKEDKEKAWMNDYRASVTVGKSFSSLWDQVHQSGVYVSFKLYRETADSRSYEVRYGKRIVGLIQVSKKTKKVTSVMWL